MDVKVRYKVNSNKQALLNLIRPQLLGKVETLVQRSVDAYLKDLERHMGTIPGSGAYTDTVVRWDALDETQLKQAPKFWVESGKAKRSISVNIQMDSNSIHAFVGISEGSEGYQEVLWNELGFTPENGDKLIRRPLFIPLADLHKAELQEQLRSLIGRQRIEVKIK